MRKIVLSIDPGSKNFAVSAMTKKGKLVDYCLINKTISNIKDGKVFEKELNDFRNEVNKILKQFSNDKCVIVFERFMPRGMHRANLSEIVNFLILSFLNESINKSYVKRIYPITAAAWKTYNKHRKMFIINKTITDHICDTMGMGLYFLVRRNHMDVERARKVAKKLSNKDFRKEK